MYQCILIVRASQRLTGPLHNQQRMKTPSVRMHRAFQGGKSLFLSPTMNNKRPSGSLPNLTPPPLCFSALGHQGLQECRVQEF